MFSRTVLKSQRHLRSGKYVKSTFVFKTLPKATAGGVHVHSIAKETQMTLNCGFGGVH